MSLRHWSSGQRLKSFQPVTHHLISKTISQIIWGLCLYFSSFQWRTKNCQVLVIAAMLVTASLGLNLPRQAVYLVASILGISKIKPLIKSTKLAALQKFKMHVAMATHCRVNPEAVLETSEHTLRTGRLCVFSRGSRYPANGPVTRPWRSKCLILVWEWSHHCCFQYKLKCNVGVKAGHCSHNYCVAPAPYNNANEDTYSQWSK